MVSQDNNLHQMVHQPVFSLCPVLLLLIMYIMMCIKICMELYNSFEDLNLSDTSVSFFSKYLFKQSTKIQANRIKAWLQSSKYKDGALNFLHL